MSEAHGSTAKIVRPPGTWAATVEGAAAAVAAKGEVPSPQCSSSSDRDSTASERVKREERRDAMQVLRYIQIIDAGRKLVACRTDGYVLSKVRAGAGLVQGGARRGGGALLSGIHPASRPAHGDMQQHPRCRATPYAILGTSRFSRFWDEMMRKPGWRGHYLNSASSTRLLGRTGPCPTRR